LLGDAKKNPRPFDRVLVADSSRISRNIRHALRYIDVLALHSVHVYFVSHKLSSENPHFKMMMTMCGVLEEQYTAAHAENVRRGQKGKVLLGYTVGSNSFGYTSVAHRRSSSKAGESGIPVLRGHRLEIIESQAAVIRRIYRMFLDGHTASQIMKTPNIIRT
jgi:DNA invertase Pin-like site-specific DNA recombinase